jgi:hypothetical protein
MVKSLIVMARPERFELPTPRFVVWWSIQLSYGRFTFRHWPLVRAATESFTTSQAGG